MEKITTKVPSADVPKKDSYNQSGVNSFTPPSSGIDPIPAQKKSVAQLLIEKSKDEEVRQMKQGADQNQSLSHSETSHKLPADVQAKMESSFGADFSDVSIHEGSNAKNIGALAYTQGSDIHFAPGQFQPHTQKGQELIGHELTHVLQQRQGRVQPTTQKKSLAINDSPALEQEADEKGKMAAQGKFIGNGVNSTEKSVQKQDDPSAVLSQHLQKGLGLATGDKGNVAPEMLNKANENLDAIRQIFNDVHADINTILHMIDALEGMDVEQMFTSEFWLNLLYEGIDAISVAVPEKAEAATVIIAKLLKVVIQAYIKKEQIIKKNDQLLSKLNTIDFLLETLQSARTTVDELKGLCKTHPNLTKYFAEMEVPNAGLQAKAISSDVEFSLYKAMLKGKEAKLMIRHTDSLAVNTKKASYYNTEHYNTAIKKHKDPEKNWFLYNNYPDVGYLPFHPTADYAYSWRVIVVENFAEKGIKHILSRMAKNSIKKEKLYDLWGKDSLPFEFCGAGTFSQIDVID